jgi:hypothetical protein
MKDDHTLMIGLVILSGKVDHPRRASYSDCYILVLIINRWKGENVSTAEVSEILGNHPTVHEANVYGVELPHHDGRAGCAAIVLASEPNETVLNSLAAHALKTLPRYAVPLFLRLMKEVQTTGTNKQQKHVVRSQGVDPQKTGDDDLFWLKGGTYAKFSRKDWDELNGGRVKL